MRRGGGSDKPTARSVFDSWLCSNYVGWKPKLLEEIAVAVTGPLAWRWTIADAQSSRVDRVLRLTPVFWPARYKGWASSRINGKRGTVLRLLQNNDAVQGCE